jgi:hypothetical protein
MEEIIAHITLIRHGSHRKRRARQFLCYCVCIRWRDNVFTEPLPSNSIGIHIKTRMLVGGIYEVRC